MDNTKHKFHPGDIVRKTKGSQWSGVVVGTYSTELTPEGYAVESSSEKGSVQIYPAAALEGVRAEISVPISQIAGLQAVGEALSGNPKALAAVEQLIEEVGRLQKASVPVCVGRELIQILAAEGQWVSMDGHGLIAADGLFRKDPYIELEKAQAEVEELRGKLNCLEQVSVSPMENPDLDWIDAMRRDKEDRDATRTKIAGLEKEVLRLKENRPAENQVLLAQLEAQVRTIQGYRMACDEKVSEINAAQVEVERLKSEVLRLRHNAAKQDAVFDGEIASLRDSAKAADEISSHRISTIASERDRLMKRCNELTLALLSKEAGKIIEWESCERERDALRKKVAEVEPVSLIGAASRPVGSVSTIHQYDAQACCNQIASLQRKVAAVDILLKALRVASCLGAYTDEYVRQEANAALDAWNQVNK